MIQLPVLKMNSTTFGGIVILSEVQHCKPAGITEIPGNIRQDILIDWEGYMYTHIHIHTRTQWNLPRHAKPSQSETPCRSNFQQYSASAVQHAESPRPPPAWHAVTCDHIVYGAFVLLFSFHSRSFLYLSINNCKSWLRSLSMYLLIVLYSLLIIVVRCRQCYLLVYFLRLVSVDDFTYLKCDSHLLKNYHDH